MAVVRSARSHAPCSPRRRSRLRCRLAPVSGREPVAALIRQRRGLWPWYAVRVLVPLAALAVEGIPAAIGALALQEGGLWLAPRLAARCHCITARRIFLAAFLLRAIIILPL